MENAARVPASDIDAVALGVLAKYPIKRAAFFGSVARGEATEESDVDMIVEFLPDTPTLEYFGLEIDLEEALKRDVDLITFRGLESSPDHRLRANILSEVRTIYERHEA